MYVVPNFNQLYNVWFGHAGPIPPISPPDESNQLCGLSPGRRHFGFVESRRAYLFTPIGTDLSSARPTLPDVVEVPQNSGRFYSVLGAEFVGLGYANQYTRVAIQQLDPFAAFVPPPPVPTTTACFDCPIAPLVWEMEIAGVTTGSCPACSLLNGKHLLLHDFGCQWSSRVNINPCPSISGQGFFQLNVSAFTQLLRLFPNAGLDPQLAAWATAVWDCMGPNVMAKTFQSAFLGCGNVPNNITVSPSP